VLSDKILVVFESAVFTPLEGVCAYLHELRQVELAAQAQ
jgi:hypothetical protein